MPNYWDRSFKSEEIQVLNAALERAWDFIERNGEVGITAPEYCRSCLAAHVMALAQVGERVGGNDSTRLAMEAIRRYRQQKAQQLAAAFRNRGDEFAAL
jgi:AhpD family alkylhydroperoxidase